MPTSALTVEPLCLGMLETNCFVVSAPSGRALLIDPADEADRITERLCARGLTLHSVLLTHGHFDHIRAVPELVAEYHVPVLLHPADNALYRSEQNGMPPLLQALGDSLPATVPELAEAPPELAFDVLHTPGHTPGSVGYLFAEAGIVFAGETLFCGGIGRSDLPGGDHEQLLHSLRTVLLRLPDETRVCCGHGPDTTIAHERRSNPFL